MKIERLFIGAAATLVCASASAQTWDAGTDWLPPSNPYQVWSYGEYNTQGTFEPLAWDVSNTEYDWDYTPGLGGAVWKDTAGYAELGVNAGQLSLDSAYGTAVVQFSAPTTGDYSFDIAIGGSTQPENGGQGNSLALNGFVAVAGTTVYRTSFVNNIKLWTFTTPLTAGQAVDASVTANGVPGEANTALSFSVDAVPEPASFLALGLGAAGLLARRKRQSK
jgi:hypothetical protein